MNIEFIDKTTVVIEESLEWEAIRPKNKIVLSSGEIVNEFLKNNKELELVSVSGPRRICNFKSKADSTGQWLLKVKQKATKKQNKQKVVSRDNSSTARNKKENEEQNQKTKYQPWYHNQIGRNKLC